MTNPDFDILASRAVEPSFYWAPVPETLPNGIKPMQFQFAGAEYCVARDNALLGDAPGLTKTAQSILIGNAIGATSTLCVVPASLRLNWEREIWAWSTIPNVRTYPVLAARDGIDHNAHYVIISYDLLRNPSILVALMGKFWDHLILDEAHALKDPKGNKRTKVLCAPDLLPSVVGRITMASGTILPNQPTECYNAIRLLNWSAIDCASLEDFRENYYDLGGGIVFGPRKVWDDRVGAEVQVYDRHWSNAVRNQPKNLEDLQYRLRKHIMVRRLKEHVLHELPPKRWHPFPLQMTSAIRAAIKHPGWQQAEKLYEMDLQKFNSYVSFDGEFSTARRELGEAKAPGVADYVEELLSEGVTKLVIGAWHHSVLDYLRDRLKGYGLVYMDGSTSTRARQQAVDQFQQNPTVQIILGQMMPLKEGWTLTAAQDVIDAEPSPVPGHNDQLLDRVHRPGQKGTGVTGHMPIVPGTLDERLVALAIGKDQHIHAALDKQ